MEHLLSCHARVFREAIIRSYENKAEVVDANELEAGMRVTLNLGHTFERQ